MFKTLPLVSSLFLLISASYVQSQPNKHWQQSGYIQDSFAQIALQSEHSKSDGLLHKWQQAIYYAVIDHTGDQSLHQKMVRQHLKHLSLITEHKIAPARSEHTANLTVIFSSELNLDGDLLRRLGISNQQFRQSLNRNSVCLAQLGYDKSANINQAIVIIPVDRARAHGKLMACVVEELSQIMGLPNDSVEVYPSIFNDQSFNDFLTGLDYLLLKLLYHSSLKAGMSSTQVHKELSEIMQTKEYTDLLESAESLVRQNSLENWLN